LFCLSSVLNKWDQNRWRPDIEETFDQYGIIPGRADNRSGRATSECLELVQNPRDFVGRMLHIEQDPVEPAVSNDLRHDVAAEAAPEPDLHLASFKSGFERIALKVHHRSPPSDLLLGMPYMETPSPFYLRQQEAKLGPVRHPVPLLRNSVLASGIGRAALALNGTGDNPQAGHRPPM
jgi:hypothetical protein